MPDMAQSFGTLEFAGESEPVFERDKNNRRVLARRSYNLYSDVQKGENVVVEIPVQAGEKKFKYEQKVKLVNPKLYGRGYAIGDMGHTDSVCIRSGSFATEYETAHAYRLGAFQLVRERLDALPLQLHNHTDSDWCLCIGRFSVLSLLLR